MHLKRNYILHFIIGLTATIAAEAIWAQNQGYYQQRPQQRQLQRPQPNTLRIRALIDNSLEAVLTGGRNFGLTSQSEVCFYQRDQKILGCHRISAITDRSARVVLPEIVFSQLSKGLPVIVGAEGSSASSAGSSNSAFIFGYAYGMQLPFKYNSVKHNEQSEEEKKAEPLTIAEKNSTAVAQIYLASEISLTPKFKLSTGIIGRIFEPKTTYSGLYPSDEVSFTEHLEAANGFAFPITTTYQIGENKTKFYIGGGIQIDHSQIQVRAWKVDPENETREKVMDFVALQTTLGPRIDFGGSINLGPTNQLRVGLGIVIPTSVLHSAATSSVDLPGSASFDTDGNTELKKMVDFDKSLGIDLTINFALGI